MEPVFAWMMGAAVFHFTEEYVYPGGFLRWMHILLPRMRLKSIDAVFVNAVFVALILSPLSGVSARMPILSLSIPALLITNGLVHVVGTIITRKYSPGLVTAVLLYFPLGVYAIVTLTRAWNLSPETVAVGIFLGASWHLIPLAAGFFRMATAS